MAINIILGASATGKLSILKGAKAALKDEPRFLFPKRFCTVPATLRDDDVQLSDAEFLKQKEAGAFALVWTIDSAQFALAADVVQNLIAESCVTFLGHESMGADCAKVFSGFPVKLICVTATGENRVARMQERSSSAGLSKEEKKQAEKLMKDRLRVVLKEPVQIPKVHGCEVAEVQNNASMADCVSAFLHAIDYNAEREQERRNGAAASDQPSLGAYLKSCSVQEVSVRFCLSARSQWVCGARSECVCLPQCKKRVCSLALFVVYVIE
jgi:ribose 1,5-bisphosphokinase